MIRTVLFDADGVIQRPQPFRRALWTRLLGGAEASVDAFLRDVFAAERPCYCGDGNFTERLNGLLTQWNCAGDLATALEAWTAIEVDPDVLDTIALLRASGYQCHLASNQEPHRARYMSEALSYRTVFEREFYSCTVGHAKPAAAYFTDILAALAVPPEETLFIDDMPANVETASSVGLHVALFAPAPDVRWHDHLRQVLRRHGMTIAPGPAGD